MKHTIEYQRAYREKHREHINAYNREWSKRKRYYLNKAIVRITKQQEYIINILKQGCKDCSCTDFRVLEFDHVPERGDKLFKITTGSNTSWGKFLAELAKCDLVCANCHAVRTYERMISEGKRPYREVLRDASTT